MKPDFLAALRKNPNATFLELGNGAVMRKTAGWTDEQIRGKSLKELDSMITQGELATAKLRETLTGEEARIQGLRLVRARKVELGD
jgi:hypothetical protein